MTSTQLAALDWERYRKLKAEGRLNLLFRFSIPLAAWSQDVDVGRPRQNLLPFISRAEHLAWRDQWKRGRFVRLSWTPDERDAILRQDKAYRRADERWELNHGPIASGARVLVFRTSRADPPKRNEDSVEARPRAQVPL
jgi:hypothetical protein